MPSETPKPPKTIGGGRFEVEKKLGAGCFGEVWRGKDTGTNEQVAVKFEDVQGRALQLEHEAEVLRSLAKPTQPEGFAELHFAGCEGRFMCMVMEILGYSLEERMAASESKFTVDTTVLVADQVLRRIEFLHSKGIVHRDIKPENWMFGLKDKAHHLYLIDFGLSKRYYDGKHVPLRAKLSLTGTARYASINAHKGIEQSRRDDLEAIGHMFLYFLRGSLPWSGLDAKTQEEKYRKIRHTKEATSLDDLCAGFPDAFKNYLRIARDLEFKERPNYQAYRKMFREVRDKVGNLEDHSFQWYEGKELGKLTSLQPWDSPRQPDDQVIKQRCMFCPCGGKSAVRD